MSDLVEFLLARFAEDEEWVRDHAAPDQSDVEPSPITPARILAECKAKRKLVEREARKAAPPRLGPAQDYYPIEQPETDTLRILAESYATHPAFREEWRPTE